MLKTKQHLSAYTARMLKKKMNQIPYFVDLYGRVPKVLFNNKIDMFSKCFLEWLFSSLIVDVFLDKFRNQYVKLHSKQCHFKKYGHSIQLSKA